MKRFVIALAISGLFSLLFVSCYYDNVEALYPSLNNSCDTTHVTFSGSIVPILSNNCYSCHSNSNSAFGANIRLEGYADVVANSVKVIAAIKQTGAKPMPPNGKLKDCSIIQFDIWIRNGMLNN
jgi:cytochrome c5